MNTATRRWALASVATAAALAGAGAALWRYRLAPAGDGALSTLWQLEAELPQGGVYSLAKLRGKPAIINFWATWCPPCVEEMPLLDAFFKENSANGWQMVGLACDQAPAVNKYLSKTPMSFPTPLAGMAGIELSRTLGNLTGGLPFTVVINRSGEIALRHMGKLSNQQIQDFKKIG